MQWVVSWRCSTKYIAIIQILCSCAHMVFATVGLLVYYKVLHEDHHPEIVQETVKLGKGAIITTVIWTFVDLLFACVLLFSTDEHRLLNHRNHCFWTATAWMIWTSTGILLYTYVAIRITDYDEGSACWPLIQIIFFCLVMPYACYLRNPEPQINDDDESQLTAELLRKKKKKSISSVVTTNTTGSSKRSYPLDPEDPLLNDNSSELSMSLMPRKSQNPDAGLPRRSLPPDATIPQFPMARRMSIASSQVPLDEIDALSQRRKSIPLPLPIPLPIPTYVSSTSKSVVKKGKRKKNKRASEAASRADSDPS